MLFLTTLLPLLLTPFFYGALIKLAALLYRRIQLSWKHAFLFGLLSMAVGGTMTFANIATGRVAPVPLVLLLSMSTQLALGGWYFKDRARMASGDPIGHVRGALLPVLAFALVFAVAAVAILLAPAP